MLFCAQSVGVGEEENETSVHWYIGKGGGDSSVCTYLLCSEEGK